MLTCLNLHGNQLTDQGVGILAHALSHSKSLTSLNLTSNQCDRLGAEQLCKSLQTNVTLTDLHIGRNKLSNDSVQCLSVALCANSTLTSLRIGFNMFNEAGAYTLTETFKNSPSLLHLDIGTLKVPELELAKLHPPGERMHCGSGYSAASLASEQSAKPAKKKGGRRLSLGLKSLSLRSMKQHQLMEDSREYIPLPHVCSSLFLITFRPSLLSSLCSLLLAQNHLANQTFKPFSTYNS
jgi:hypothetical protein